MADNDEGKGAAQTLKEGATQLKDSATQTLKEGATQLKDSAAQLAEQQKTSGARQLSGIAGAVLG